MTNPILEIAAEAYNKNADLKQHTEPGGKYAARKSVRSATLLIEAAFDEQNLTTPSGVNAVLNVLAAVSDASTSKTAREHARGLYSMLDA